MDWNNQHMSSCGYPYDRFIEESIRSKTAYYRPAYLAPNRWAHEFKQPPPERIPRPAYFICVKLAGPTVVRIRLPRWVSVRVMFS